MQYIVNSANKRSSKPTSSDPSATGPKKGLPAVAANTVINDTKKYVVDRQASDTDTLLAALKIISQESGIEIIELTDDAHFDDIGVDSLLSIMVSSRIRDELDIDFDSAVFLELKTVGQFKTFLTGFADTKKSTNTLEAVQKEMPPIESNTHTVNENYESVDTWQNVLSIVAEESGIAISELTGDTQFADIGVDSLLSLVVCSRMRDELELDVPNQSLFLDFPTVESLRNRIIGVLTPLEPEPELSDSGLSTATSSNSSLSDLVKTPGPEVDDAHMKGLTAAVSKGIYLVKPAWSITLQGSPKNATERLFLFPDGCGAATSYIKLPAISPSTAVIGFNSPFMK